MILMDSSGGILFLKKHKTDKSDSLSGPPLSPAAGGIADFEGRVEKYAVPFGSGGDH